MIGWNRQTFAAFLYGWLSIVALSCGVRVAAAQESLTESRPRFDVAIGTWISTGDTRWAHNASSSSPLLGDPTSKLTYKDVGTNVFDLAGTLWFTPRLFGRLNFGIAGNLSVAGSAFPVSHRTNFYLAIYFREHPDPSALLSSASSASSAVRASFELSD